jgi:hypothetical protein
VGIHCLRIFPSDVNLLPRGDSPLGRFVAGEGSSLEEIRRLGDSSLGQIRLWEIRHCERIHYWGDSSERGAGDSRH